MLQTHAHQPNAERSDAKPSNAERSDAKPSDAERNNPEHSEPRRGDRSPCHVTRKNGARGQALLELTFATPMLFLLLVLAIDFGGWLYAWTEVGNAARAAANYAILGPLSAGGPVTPTGTALTAMIASDLATLPNYSSTNPAVIVCWNSNGTITAITGTCSSPPLDPEATSFISVSVDLTYTYSPLIPSFTYPQFGITLPSLPATIHRRIVMRFI